jgi:hypothetical protein
MRPTRLGLRGGGPPAMALRFCGLKDSTVGRRWLKSGYKPANLQACCGLPMSPCDRSPINRSAHCGVLDGGLVLTWGSTALMHQSQGSRESWPMTDGNLHEKKGSQRDETLLNAISACKYHDLVGFRSPFPAQSPGERGESR